MSHYRFTLDIDGYDAPAVLTITWVEDMSVRRGAMEWAREVLEGEECIGTPAVLSVEAYDREGRLSPVGHPITL